MAHSVLEIAERLWRGDAQIEDHSPFAAGVELAEVAEGAVFIQAFGNVSAVRTDAGLFLIDTGIHFLANQILEALRSWSDGPIMTVAYTHGHVDHVTGMNTIAAAATSRKDPPPRVIAHEDVGRRFDRYIRTAGYNSIINRRQFGVKLPWPTEYHYPDETYSRQIIHEQGGVEIELNHARGETDDHTWIWIPSMKVIATGDFFIWCSPNAGNPQKVPRYPDEWAAALRAMATRHAEVLLPGHGFPIIGADRVESALIDTATYLESLVDQTIELMNSGATLDEIIHSVTPPPDLLEKPYLKPVYDEPEFIVRNVWRLHGGWFDGIASHLKPPPDSQLAQEVARLVGKPEPLIERASELADEGEFRIACAMADLAALAWPESIEVARARTVMYEKRVTSETSLMAKGIFTEAAREAR